jgi:MinD superfamily P-loop ATPase
MVMEPSDAGEVTDGATTVGPIAYGQLAPGEDLSGKLVTEVRGHAEAAAAAWGAELLLIDGPPGVGCPATASITNTELLVAVAEPTISGVHDLRRLIGLARRLNVPVAVVLNKADLSEEGATMLRDLAAAEALEIVGEIPFDPSLAGVLERLASCRSRAKPGAPATRRGSGSGRRSRRCSPERLRYNPRTGARGVRSDDGSRAYRAGCPADPGGCR